MLSVISNSFRGPLDRSLAGGHSRDPRERELISERGNARIAPSLLPYFMYSLDARKTRVPAPSERPASAVFCAGVHQLRRSLLRQPFVLAWKFLPGSPETDGSAESVHRVPPLSIPWAPWSQRGSEGDRKGFGATATGRNSPADLGLRSKSGSPCRWIGFRYSETFERHGMASRGDLRS